ncbi:MAG: type II secretion system F family protein [Acidobacteria bacterium]|nr:type II secretion system F family protein [Acidobacteriota bacterium]
MIALLAALLAGLGTALLLGSPTVILRPRIATVLAAHRSPLVVRTQLASGGAAFLVGAAVCLTLFGSIPAAICGGAFAAPLPVAVHRQRERDRLEVARDSWPRMIDELRVLTSSAGRSIAQAFIELGTSAPTELRAGFEAARREWLLTADLSRMLEVLRRELADPTCDAICETVLVAAEFGATDLDQRLLALAEDRRVDTRNRREARARQAGVRFARRFVLLVPFGMAIAGLTMGSGRAAYRTPMGQVAVLVALIVTAGCWMWAGSMLRLPDERRVFSR